MYDPDFAFVFLPFLVVAGGIVVVLAAMHQQTRRREMAHRERLAMIEKGLLPPPEVDPGRFNGAGPVRRGSTRSLTAGIVTIGLGLGLGLIIGFAGEEPGVAMGVGGAMVVLGAAFVVNALLTSRPAEPPPGAPPARGPDEPPA